MKILSWNVNGIRSAYRNDFARWLETSNPDIVCLQEIKAEKSDVEKLFIPDLFNPFPYHLYVNSATKPGYSGVAVLTKLEPLRVDSQLGEPRFDSEGRILRLEFDDFVLINLYIPHGGREKENLPYKLHVYHRLLQYVRQPGVDNMILAGDFNVAHEEIDLARPKENHFNTMFTAEERHQLDELITSGFTDTFRSVNPEGGYYTWWPYSAVDRDGGSGWRIDYMFASRRLSPQVRSAFILREVRGSDHCPIGVEIGI